MRRWRGVCVEHFLLGQPLVAALRDAGLSVTTGTINHAAVAERALAYAPDAVTSDRPHQLAAELAQRLSRNTKVTVGAAGPVSEGAGARAGRILDDLAAAHTEALRTAEALVALGRRGDGASAADLGFAGLIVGTRPEVAAYVHSVLGALVDYDTARGTDLVGTLDAYFLAGSSPRHAATRLHVHTNTVAQRLERITRLVGDEWQSPERALELQLALRLRHLVAS